MFLPVGLPSLIAAHLVVRGAPPSSTGRGCSVVYPDTTATYLALQSGVKLSKC